MRSFIIFLLMPTALSAGVNYSRDARNELPAEWAGFLRDQRAMRLAADPKQTGFNGYSTLRDTALDAVAELETLRKTRPLTADELADLGALHLRLGEPEKAVAVLRAAARQFSEHYRIAANLGTAWQLAGDFNQAAAALEEAVRLAPKDRRPLEELHLKLVRGRAKEKKPGTVLDDLFDGKPPANALALVQELALAFPFDGRLLWQLAEIAAASGDPRTGANLLDGAINELGLNSDEARMRRSAWRATADKLAEKNEHGRGTLKFASSRVFKSLLDESKLPKIDPDGINVLPWSALAETTLTRKFEPKFLKYVDSLDGQRIRLTGFIRPGRADRLTEFSLTEAPIGCWYCEAPGATQVMWVELAEGATTDVPRGAVDVVGKLELNRTDPETHLLRVVNARVKKVE